MEYEKLKDKFYAFGFLVSAMPILQLRIADEDAKALKKIIKDYYKNKALQHHQVIFYMRKLRVYRNIIKEDYGKNWEVEPLKFANCVINKVRINATNKSVKLNKTKQLEIRFDYDQKIVGELKQKLTSERTFNKDNPQDPYWTCFPSPKNITALRQIGFEIPSEVTDYLDSFDIGIPEYLKKQLREYQKEGAQFLIESDGRALLADDMGIGKTIQSIAWLAANPGARPAIVSVPASLRLNWGKELSKWLPNERFEIIRDLGQITENINIGVISFNFAGKVEYLKDDDGNFIYKTKRSKIMYAKIPNAKPYILAAENPTFDYVVNTPKDYVITRYAETGIEREREKASRVVANYPTIDAIRKILNPKALIIDEIHRINNPSALQTRALSILGKKTLHLIGLSGTPIENRAKDLFTVLHLIDPVTWPSRWKFQMRYCDPKNNGYGWQYNGASHLDELFQRIQPILLRRKKVDVLKELPLKQRIVVPMEIDSAGKKAYDRYIQKAFEGKKSKAQSLDIVEALKQLAVKAKWKSCVDWIKDYLENNPKLVVACNHREFVESLHKTFKKNSVVIYGGLSDTKKEKAVEQFQENENINLLIGNIKATGVGYNLTAASDTATIELMWNPGVHDQLEDRVLRIGQKNLQSSNHYYLLADDTIEIDIAALIDQKREMITQVMEGKEVDELDLLTELLKKYQKETLK